MSYINEKLLATAYEIGLIDRVIREPLHEVLNPHVVQANRIWHFIRDHHLSSNDMPDRHTISQELHLHLNTVSTFLRVLVKLGAIRVEECSGYKFYAVVEKR